QKTIVLLKNENNQLPLQKNLESIAVIGPNSDSIRNLFGDYAYPAHVETLAEFKRQSNVFAAPLPDDIISGDDFISSISILQAIRSKVGAGTQIHYAEGCDVLDTSTEGFAEAVE